MTAWSTCSPLIVLMANSVYDISDLWANSDICNQKYATFLPSWNNKTKYPEFPSDNSTTMVSRYSFKKCSFIVMLCYQKTIKANQPSRPCYNFWLESRLLLSTKNLFLCICFCQILRCRDNRKLWSCYTWQLFNLKLMFFLTKKENINLILWLFVPSVDKMVLTAKRKMFFS